MKKLFVYLFAFLFISCNSSNKTNTIEEIYPKDKKYKTEYTIFYSTYYCKKYVIYTDDSTYTCSFSGTNFLLEKGATEEILSTTAPIEIRSIEKIN